MATLFWQFSGTSCIDNTLTALWDYYYSPPYLAPMQGYVYTAISTGDYYKVSTVPFISGGAVGTQVDSLTITGVNCPGIGCDTTYCATNCCYYSILNEGGSSQIYSYYDCSGILVNDSVNPGITEYFCSDQSYGPISAPGIVTVTLLGCCRCFNLSPSMLNNF